MSQQDITKEESDRPEHLEGKVSTFDFTMALVHLYTELEACCQLIEINLHKPKELQTTVGITKLALKKQQKEIERLLEMDVDVTLELDHWQLGVKP